ncbi:hypothetical protein HPB52_004177 [Rhipicephalus sanguineus]|uniref:HTH CENPB-type domain-containing protein n=1 Tax=Rhipicephalus sanguineus TaxID=34632 RepID=A0A9D4PLP1_RHISA|nr:hypothetical protein HPB52_004177 [Rhipicephalus sanguineus]
MSGSRWQSFTAKEKLEIIAAAEEIGNRAAARRHDVDESCICNWRKKKASLESAHKEKRAFCGPKTGAYPLLETQLVKFIQERRSRGHAVSTEMAQMEALRLAREMNISREFRASRGWLQRFGRMRRPDIALLAATKPRMAAATAASRAMIEGTGIGAVNVAAIASK